MMVFLSHLHLLPPRTSLQIQVWRGDGTVTLTVKVLGESGESIRMKFLCAIQLIINGIGLIGLAKSSLPSDSSVVLKPCSSNNISLYVSHPKISFRYDGRQFNQTFQTLRKSSARDNNIYLSCFAPYPVTLKGVMSAKSDIPIKLFEENMETHCMTEVKPDPSLTPECRYYSVNTSFPVHHLDENVISAMCESFCAQVEHYTNITVEEKRKVIHGKVSIFKSKGRGNWTWEPKKEVENVDVGNGSKSGLDVFRWEGVNHKLVQIFISPVGAQGKYWNIKCTTYSALTARGAWLIMKLKNSEELFLANYTKEYRKAGIHTIRTTFDRPSADIEYLLCLFPRLNDFTWISRSTSIHFEDPMTYWECVLHFCGAFVGLFIILAGVCYGIHIWLHSPCLDHHHKHDDDRMTIASMVSSQHLSQQEQRFQPKFRLRQWSQEVDEEDDAQNQNQESLSVSSMEDQGHGNDLSENGMEPGADGQEST